MSKTALFFPGQASQYVGMGKDLYEYSADVRRLYEFASDQLGVDIARLSFEGPAEELKRTKYHAAGDHVTFARGADGAAERTSGIPICRRAFAWRICRAGCRGCVAL